MPNLILLDPHLNNSKLFPLLNEVYTVQVYMGINDLPKTTDSWIVSKWTLVDGNATDIPKQFRDKLIVIDEYASVEAWQKCKTAEIRYTTEIGDMLQVLREYFDIQNNLCSNYKQDEHAATIAENNNAKNVVIEKPVIKQGDEPARDPFAVSDVNEEPKEEVEDTKREIESNLILDSKQIIAVTQKKGGTGKTTVTQTASRIIAERGQKILVIELDPDGGHLASRLDIRSKGNINLLNQGYSLENVIEKRIDKAVAIDYILSPDFSKREVIRIEVIKNMIIEAREEYDVIIIDCGTAWDDTVKTAIKFATQVWMVSTPDPAALLDGRVLYTKLIQSNVEPDRIVHLINKSVKSKNMSLVTIQENVPVSKVFLLPDDQKVTAIQQQKREPIDCKFGKKLREVIDEIVPHFIEEEEETIKWWRKIPGLRRLFA